MEKLLLRTRATIGSRSVHGEAPMRPLHSNPITVPGSDPHRKANQFIRRCHLYARKSASQAVLSRMQLTHHATRRTLHVSLRAWCLAMSVWSVKTPDVLRPGIVRMRGPTVTRLQACMIMSKLPLSNRPPCLLYTSPSPRD